MKLKLDNKVILITGAGKGIGKEILNKLLKEKNIIYAVTRSVKDFKKIKKRKNLFLLHGDITKKEIIYKIFDLAKKNKHIINCLVNNAGIRQRKNFNLLTESDLKLIFENNFFSIFNATKEFVKQFKFKKNFGSIVNISSIVGELGFKELSGYAATKSATNGFTKSLSDELPRKKIRVNSIAPGFIKSSYYNNFKKNKKILYKWTLSRIPLGKWGENTDVADLTLFLLSENSKYINGQIIKVDGGWTST